MVYPKNQHVYYLPYVRVKSSNTKSEELVYHGHVIPVGAELPISQDIITFGRNENEVHVMLHDKYACNIFPIPLVRVELFVKVVYPLFQIGDVVVKKVPPKIAESVGDGVSAFRIYEYTIVQGKVWYRDGWCIATGCESGVHEDSLRLAVGTENKSWSVNYYDNLVKAKNQTLYNSTVK